ncbi:DUF1684 domain-containing protein [bacterium]|nr:DUF1684 domain-containing protein [bacterium]
MKQLSVLIFLSIIVFSCKPAKDKKPADPSYIAAIDEWHNKRVERLKSPTGWLSLVGLHWLKEGENKFGGDSSNQLIFPKKAPAFCGSFFLQNGKVSLDVAKGIQIVNNGIPVTQMQLRSDADSNTTVLQMNSFRFFVIKRGHEFAIRLRDTENPLISSFKGIERYPVDPSWLIEAKFEAYSPPKIIGVPTIMGTIDSSKCPGVLVFEIDDETYRLEPVLDEGSDELFIIFGDKTNGFDTYGGGRFLYAKKPGADDKIIIDFNKAYNPPCVFTEFATCPLPPSQNKLPIKITAGEKMWGKAHQ